MAPNAARKKVVNHSDFLLGVVLFMVPTIGPMQMFSDLEQNAPDPARRDLLGSNMVQKHPAIAWGIKTFKTPNILSSHLELPVAKHG